MGLHMDNIHTPSVPSGPASSRPSQVASDGKKPLLDLIADKGRLESELSALLGVLQTVRLPLHLYARYSCSPS